MLDLCKERRQVGIQQDPRSYQGTMFFFLQALNPLLDLGKIWKHGC